MKTTTILAALAGAQFAAAHTTVWNVLVNGKDAGVGNTQGGYIDSPPNNSPVKDVQSTDMTCNVANIKASTSVPVNGGDEITVQWHHDSNAASDDILDPSHKGPIMVYISKAGASLSWTKIWEDGYDGAKWAVDKLIAGSYTGTPGQHKLTLPKLTPGDYVLRPEINALHEGDRVGGAQFYMECIHLKVGGSGTAALPAGVSIPGAYSANDAGILFNLYGSFTTYPFPGPKVWDGASGAAAPAATTAKPVTTKAPAGPTSAAPAPAKPVTTNVPAAPAPAKPVTKTTLVTVAKPAPTVAVPANGAAALAYGQCGGINFTGPTACASGWTCKVSNPYYSQCVQ